MFSELQWLARRIVDIVIREKTKETDLVAFRYIAQNRARARLREQYCKSQTY